MSFVSHFEKKDAFNLDLTVGHRTVVLDVVSPDYESLLVSRNALNVLCQ